MLGRAIKDWISSPRRIAAGMTLLVLGLILASLLGQFLRYVLGLGNVLGLPNLFDVKMEGNVPTLYSVAALLFCSFLAVRAALADRLRRSRNAARWWVLASVFLYLAMDELFKLHERLGTPFGENTLGLFGLDPTILFLQPWVLYGTVLALVVGVICLRLFVGLPSRIRWLFVAAGALYVLGAVGLELFYARFEFIYGRQDTIGILVLSTTLEELLEMMGVVVAAYALSSYVSWSSQGGGDTQSPA